jgi:putative hemolysin
MTPRQQIKSLDVSTPPAEVLARVADLGHSRIPVYQGSPDEVAGVVSLKDVLRAATRGRPPVLATLLRPPVFVPETAPISVLLREFQRTREALALVVDEYGRVVGLVTIEDVMEEIVGDIHEEGESQPSRITRMPDGSFLVEGMARVDEVEHAMGVELPESRDYATIAGFILATLESVPTPGTSVMAAGLRWTVVEMEGHRINRISVQAVQR